MKSAHALLMFCGLTTAAPSWALQCPNGRSTLSIDYHAHVDRKPKPGENKPDLSTEFYRGTLRVSLASDYVSLASAYVLDRDGPALEVQIAGMKATRMRYSHDYIDWGNPCLQFPNLATIPPTESGLVRFNGATQHVSPHLCFSSAREAEMKIEFEVRSDAVKTPKPLQAKDLRLFLMLKPLEEGGWEYMFDTTSPCNK